MNTNQQREIETTLIYKGKVAAWKLYMKYHKCRLEEARQKVKKIGEEIVPSQAN